jgi:hypothetical protein
MKSFISVTRGSGDSAVGIATGYGLDGQGVGVRGPVGERSPRPVLGTTELPIQRISNALSPGVKRPGQEAEHSPPTSAEVKNTYIYTCTLTLVFMV